MGFAILNTERHDLVALSRERGLKLRFDHPSRSIVRQCPLVDSHVIVGLDRSVHCLAVEIYALRRFLLRQMLHLHLCLATQAAPLPVLVHRAHKLL